MAVIYTELDVYKDNSPGRAYCYQTHMSQQAVDFPNRILQIMPANVEFYDFMPQQSTTNTKSKYAMDFEVNERSQSYNTSTVIDKCEPNLNQVLKQRTALNGANKLTLAGTCENSNAGCQASNLPQIREVFQYWKQGNQCLSSKQNTSIASINQIDFDKAYVSMIRSPSPTYVHPAIKKSENHKKQLRVQLKLKLQLARRNRRKRQQDEQDQEDHCYTFVYHHEILAHLQQLEQEHRPLAHFMRYQTELNHAERAFLVDCLVQVIEDFDLDTEILHLSVANIDRFLSRIIAKRSQLELVGITALYVAAKYEDAYAPLVEELCDRAGLQLQTQQILSMEQFMLKTLDFTLGTPTAYSFISVYAALIEMPNTLKYLTWYICELSLLETEPYLQFFPSLIAAASHALARYLLAYDIWTTKLIEVSNYRLADLKYVFLALSKSHLAACSLPQERISLKYAHEKYHKVALLVPVVISECVFDDCIVNCCCD